MDKHTELEKVTEAMSKPKSDVCMSVIKRSIAFEGPIHRGDR